VQLLRRFPPKTVLVIDDDPIDREFIVDCLRTNGVSDQIFAVADGQSGIDYIAGRGPYEDRAAFPYPSTIIMDLKMPNGDGFAVLEYLKKHPDHAIIPVLVMSGSDDEDDVKRAYRMGAACYFQKPQDLHQLRAALDIFYKFWALCLLPKIDASGKQTTTWPFGKLGERFGKI
jgi:CheY-like chemotaxis protein